MARNRIAAVLIAATLITGALGLAGCATSSPTPSASSTVSPLAPVVPKKLTSDTAKSETERLAGLMIALVPSVALLNDDVHAQEVPATSTNAAYYGDIHTITLDASVDPQALAKSIVKKLKAAGWVSRNTSDASGQYLAALSSDAVTTNAWFVVVGGDSSVAGESVLSLQLASPDLP